MDGKPNYRNKAAFSHFSSAVWTGSNIRRKDFFYLTVTIISVSTRPPLALASSALFFVSSNSSSS